MYLKGDDEVTVSNNKFSYNSSNANAWMEIKKRRILKKKWQLISLRRGGVIKTPKSLSDIRKTYPKVV